jgi:hypothetical protein
LRREALLPVYIIRIIPFRFPLCWRRTGGKEGEEGGGRAMKSGWINEREEGDVEGETG